MQGEKNGALTLWVIAGVLAIIELAYVTARPAPAAPTARASDTPGVAPSAPPVPTKTVIHSSDVTLEFDDWKFELRSWNSFPLMVYGHNRQFQPDLRDGLKLGDHEEAMLGIWMVIENDTERSRRFPNVALIDVDHPERRAVGELSPTTNGRYLSRLIDFEPRERLMGFVGFDCYTGARPANSIALRVAGDSGGSVVVSLKGLPNTYGLSF